MARVLAETSDSTDKSQRRHVALHWLIDSWESIRLLTTVTNRKAKNTRVTGAGRQR